MINFLTGPVNWAKRLCSSGWNTRSVPLQRPNLSLLAQDKSQLPSFVQACPVAMKYLDLLGPLDWTNFQQRSPYRAWPGPRPQAHAPFVAAYLVKLNEDKPYMSKLRDFLLDHPALVWLLGFDLRPDPKARYGFNVEASVPSRKRLGRILGELDNQALQLLLDDTIRLIQQALPPDILLGDEISMDTKHIVAWVQENNPKAYLKTAHRLDKTRQPQGDRHCKLGCKKKSNQQPAPSKGSQSAEAETTPHKKGRRITQYDCDQYFWGYATGLVATKVPGYGEFLLAELTQPFDCDDLTYFFPLMQAVERRLGRKPRFGAFDAAFDAFYVFDYFEQAGGFAAIPFCERGGYKKRAFDPHGLPLCAAGLAMPLKSTYLSKKRLVPQRVGRHVCPLLFPEPTAQRCPIDHPNWAKGGCLTRIGVSKGARLRYQLDRESEAYKHLYKQRTATERVNSQAVALGIERPKLRTLPAIANQNTLIYILINLRAYHRLSAPVP
jgi:hypothetical protein